ncbi:MAG: hypothetical protein M1835_002333 [Candelina submexicana]|nr:MAG: hypothetical protein M1835_002333 [Candelina submexicana]
MSTIDKARINAIADDVLRNTHAYDDVQAGKKGKTQVVKTMLQRWAFMQEGMITHNIGHSWTYYKKQCGQKTREYTNQALEGRDPSSNQPDFKHFPTNDRRHLRILDSEGNIIAYRFRIPEGHIMALQESASYLQHWVKGKKLQEEAAGSSKGKEKAQTSIDKRGVVARNYGVYKSYTPMPRLKADLLEDIPSGANHWLDHNKDLWAYLGDVGLRNLNPRMYGMFKHLAEFLPLGVEPVASPWLSVATNVFQYGAGNPHVDFNDMGFGYNVVVGWADKGSDWTSDLLLWQVKLRIEMVPGDAVFFLGRIFTHNAVVTSGGPRHVVDLYSHAAVLNYCKGIKRRGGQRDQPDKDIKNFEIGFQRYDAPDPGYHPNRELEVEVEAEESLQNELARMFSENM